MCLAAVAIFAWSVAFFYLPGQGFTYMAQFGTVEHARYLPELRAVNHYERANSPGYDSQWYAQIAMHPYLRDPLLKKAVDSLQYRARRILFVWTAWILGGGDPVRALNVYAAQNIVCWFILAALLLRWFPPISWGNCFRWAAVLYSFGLIFSVTSALLDGPSLLLTVVAMMLIESGRPWTAALVFGISGLGKDTSVLGGAALRPPEPRRPRTWAPWLAQGALVLLPVAAWMLCLRLWLGKGDDIGPRNFAPPFVGLMNKLGDALSSTFAGGYPNAVVTRIDLLVLVGLLAQFLFFVLRRRWLEPWWRVGACYCVLMVFLGDAVWENYPSAAARVLLPMTLAFNIMVPRKGLWPILLVIGNLGALGSAELLKPPGRESFVVEGPRELMINPADRSVVEAVFGPRNWWGPEKSRWEFFRWSLGDSTVAIRNPQPFAIRADIKFNLRSVDERGAVVTLGGKVVCRAALKPAEVVPATIRDVVLKPGDTVLLFHSDRPASYPGNFDPRRLTYQVRHLEIDLKEKL